MLQEFLRQGKCYENSTSELKPLPGGRKRKHKGVGPDFLSFFGFENNHEWMNKWDNGGHKNIYFPFVHLLSFPWSHFFPLDVLLLAFSCTYSAKRERADGSLAQSASNKSDSECLLEDCLFGELRDIITETTRVQWRTELFSKAKVKMTL